MPTKIHFSESDHIVVVEEYPEVESQLRTSGGSWVELHPKDGEPVTINVNAVRYALPYERQPPTASFA